MRGCVALVGRQAAVPEAGRGGQGTWLAHLALDGGTCLADGAATWISRLSYRFDGGVAVEDVGRRAVVARDTRWRGLGRGEGVVGQAGVNGQREVGAHGRGRQGGRGLGGQGQAVSPQGFQAQLGGAVEGVEVEGLVDVLVLRFGLTAGRAVVARVIQGVDLAAFTPRDEWVFFDGVQVFCNADQNREGGEGRAGRRAWRYKDVRK